ncbi:MAG: hypothetical protein FWE32_03625 [Oscillospiraceae bacterium]|nr:hypothetical protein [Oscillospiraceae bacterium]
MNFMLNNLSDDVRQLMVDEIQFDLDAGQLYLSDRLTPGGKSAYPKLLKEAAVKGDVRTFSQSLSGNFNATYQRRKPKGGFTTVTMPITAADTLAEGEFNRFYIRGVCRKAINRGVEVRVYRAKPVSNPRLESERKISTIVNPENLLKDLRNNIGIDTALGIPPGPNSGLSVELM